MDRGRAGVAKAGIGGSDGRHHAVDHRGRGLRAAAATAGDLHSRNRYITGTALNDRGRHHEIISPELGRSSSTRAPACGGRHPRRPHLCVLHISCWLANSCGFGERSSRPPRSAFRICLAERRLPRLPCRGFPNPLAAMPRSRLGSRRYRRFENLRYTAWSEPLRMRKISGFLPKAATTVERPWAKIGAAISLLRPVWSKGNFMP